MLTRRLTLAASAALVARSVRAGLGDEWTIATEYPASAIPGEGIAFFAAAVSESAGGALHVQPRFDAPDGIRSATMPKAVADGAVTAGDAFAAPLASLSPIFELSSLPFLTGSSADAARLLALARPAYEAAFASRGLALLYATVWPPTGLWSRAPVPDAAALQGLRIRTYDAASTTVLTAAGARPRLISFADAMPLLSAGELDGVLSSGDGGAGARLWDTLPHFTMLDYAFPLSLAFCAERVLAALPPSLGSVIRSAAAATEARQLQAMTTRVVENERRMRANGVRIAEVPVLREVLTGCAAPVVTAWAGQAGPQGTRILSLYRAGNP